MTKNFSLTFSTFLFAWLFTACTVTNDPIQITQQGIGPIKLGMNTNDLPAQINGLYDEIAIDHQDGFYDELEDEEFPPMDIYSFLLHGNVMFTTTLPTGQTTITQLTAISPILSYNGVHPGLACQKVLAAGAKLYSGGSIETCWFLCCFQFPDINNIRILFKPFGEHSAFTEKGYAKFIKEIEWQQRDDVYPEDFNEDAIISEIQISSTEE